MTVARNQLGFNLASSMPDAFVHAAWYVAAWSSEITRTPLRRVLLDEPVVFYRSAAGNVVALADRCVHRAYPLSRGVLDGDAIVCGYHGFAFEPDGTCSHIPGQASVPRSARVPVYPVVESGPFVWIWMGDPAKADPAAIPDHGFALDPEWKIIADMRTLRCRFALVLDNLMDLSHETFIHADTIGTMDVAETPIRTEVEGTTVRAFRHMENAPVPPFYRQSTGISGTIDRWQDIEYDVPAFYTLHVRVAEAGAPDERAFFSKVMYALTPETRTSTHDFWLISRKGGERPAWVDNIAIAGQNAVLKEDIDALEALEANLPLDGGWQELSVGNDRGGLLWRRIYKERLAAERAESDQAALDRITLSPV